LKDGLSDIFSGKRVEAATLAELEDLLITADMGPVTAARLAGAIAKRRFDQADGPDAVASRNEQLEELKITLKE
ncbi:MAG: signal recognition particle receptor subunit alpha, partial [Ilumatobacter sp.]